MSFSKKINLNKSEKNQIKFNHLSFIYISFPVKRPRKKIEKDGEQEEKKENKKQKKINKQNLTIITHHIDFF